MGIVFDTQLFFLSLFVSFEAAALAESLGDDVLELTVRGAEFILRPLLDRLHHLGIDTKCKTLCSLFCHTLYINGAKCLHSLRVELTRRYTALRASC